MKIVFEWDEEKRQNNIEKHGVDFPDAADVFEDPEVSILPDLREDYGEDRFNAYGFSNGRKMRVCFTLRNDKIRVITMFKANERDWRKYYGKNN